MNPSEFEKFSLERQRLLSTYVELNNSSPQAKKLWQQYQNIIKLEKLWKEIDKNIQQNKHSLNSIAQNISFYRQKLRSLLNNGDSSVNNRKETDILTDVIINLEWDEKIFNQEKEYLKEQKQKIYQENLEVFKQVGINLSSERNSTIKKIKQEQLPIIVEADIESIISSEGTLVEFGPNLPSTSQDFSREKTESESDDEGLVIALRNHEAAVRKNEDLRQEVNNNEMVFE